MDEPLVLNPSPAMLSGIIRLLCTYQFKENYLTFVVKQPQTFIYRCCNTQNSLTQL
jgi:hypothetical protein